MPISETMQVLTAVHVRHLNIHPLEVMRRLLIVNRANQMALNNVLQHPYTLITSAFTHVIPTTMIDQEFVNFLLVAKFHSEHPSSHPQTSPDYVISSRLHNSIFLVFIGEVWTM